MTYDWYVTGHRPEKLHLRDPYSPLNHARLSRFAGAKLVRHEVESVTTGVALGWDLAVAHAASVLGIPFRAAVPCEGQESRWPKESQAMYRKILAQAEEVVVATPGPYHGGVMHVRDAWLVDNGLRCLALWNGDEKGGTYHTVGLAEKAGHRIVNCWKSWEKWREK